MIIFIVLFEGIMRVLKAFTSSSQLAWYIGLDFTVMAEFVELSLRLSQQ